MAKKSNEELKNVNNMIEDDYSQLANPLLVALAENDKNNMFKTNVTTVFHKTGFHLFDFYFGAVINIHDQYGNLIRQEPRVGQAGGTFNLIIGNSGTGKAQPLSSNIITPNGPVKMKDIKVGSQVIGTDGRAHTVVGVFPQGIKDVYEVTFSDGRTVRCCGDHLWNVYSTNHGHKTMNTLPLSEIMKHYKHQRVSKGILKDGRKIFIKGRCKHKYQIQTLQCPVEYNTDYKIPIIPSILGVLITSALYHKNESRLVVYSCNEWDIRLIETVYNVSAIKLNKTSDAHIRVLYIFIKHDGSYLTNEEVFGSLYKEMTQYNGKHIPTKCMYMDIRWRMNLFLTLMINGSHKYIRGNTVQLIYHTDHEHLAQQIMSLARGLGFNCKISNRDNGDILMYLPMDIIENILFNQGSDIDEYFSNSENIETPTLDYVYIQDIRLCLPEECKCIMVDTPDHLYLTEDYVVTHNTTLAIQMAANIIRQYPYSNVIHYDCENRIDVSRCENVSGLPSSYFISPNTGAERYLIRTGLVGLDTIQEMIVKTYVNKMKLKDKLMINSGYTGEFDKDIKIMQPTVIIIDSITTVLSETFSYNNTKDASDAEKMRTNTDGARDAKTLKGFFKDIIPLIKEANIIIYGINHINSNMSMNAFTPVAKQQNYLKADEIIPGGKTMIFYPFNIIKLTAKTGDSYYEDTDGFNGYPVMIEPIKSSSNQSGNNSKGVSFEMIFSNKYGFDSLRTIIAYGREHGLIEGNKNRLRFKDDDSFTFTFKNIHREKFEKPIWENVNKYIVPTLNEHLSFTELDTQVFDDRSLNY